VWRPPPNPSSARVAEADSASLPVIAGAMGSDDDLARKRLARGCRCFGAWIGHDLAGYGWLSTGPEWIGELELEIAPDPGDGYVWNCATVPAYRRRGVFRSMLAGMIAQAREDGLRRIWIGSVAIPAEKAVGPSGFAPALVFSTTAIAGLRLMRIASAPTADAALAADALRVLSAKPGMSLRRPQPRRH
jgi:GNAT superfamily N-acetyltransferase